jgi:hypothetical protein
VHDANNLTQALHSRLVVLRLKRALLIDFYVLMAESHCQEEWAAKPKP